MEPLEKLVDSVIGFHSKELAPYHERVAVMRQMFLFPETARANHVSLGNYYETMTHALYGGELTNRCYAPNGNGSDSGGRKVNVDFFGKGEQDFLGEDSEGVHLIKPDLIDKRGKKIGESKACCAGHSTNLLDGQINRYRDIQIIESDSEIYFAFYRHNLHSIKSYKGDEEELFGEMAGRTFFSLRVLFSIILAMHRAGVDAGSGNGRIFRRYEGETFPHCTIIRSPVINRLLSAPSGVLEDFGLDEKDYVIRRVLSPGNLKINRARVRQFPIVYIADRNHSKWVKAFLKENYDMRADGCSD